MRTRMHASPKIGALTAGLLPWFLDANMTEIYCRLETPKWPVKRMSVDCHFSRKHVRRVWPFVVSTAKAKFHYAILVADRSEAGRRPASSC